MLRPALLVLLVVIAAPTGAQDRSSGFADAERAALKADARARELRRTADAVDAEIRKARFDAIALARRIQAGEARATKIERSIARLEILRRNQRARLADKQGEISRLLAALQTLSRRPVSLVLLEPRTALTTARVSALLGAVRPELARRTSDLRAELASTRQLRTQLLDAKRQLGGAKTMLAANIKSLDDMQVRKRETRDERDAEADKERRRAQRLANQAISLRELASAVERDTRRQRPGTKHLEVRVDGTLAGPDYHMPVSGGVQLGFGRPNTVGVRSRGLTLATRDNAQVTAPANGRVAYAGQFRAYGDIVIIEHDDDMLSLISGMERVDVVVGEAVRPGTPIGRMGSARPELYLELRHGGTPVDPLRYARNRS